MGGATSKFDFELAYGLVQALLATVGPDSPYLARVGPDFTLSSQGCKALMGTGWNMYPAKDIIDRLVRPGMH